MKTAVPATIDLRRVIGRKNPSLLAVVPRAVIRHLERIVHVDELNEVLHLLRDRYGLDFARGALDYLGARVVARGADRLRLARRPIVVANHPLGGLDGLALLVTVGEQTGDVVLPANDLLMNLENLTPVLVPVNKHGSNRDNRELFERAFSGGPAVVHFPAGLCSRKKGGTVRDLDWQKSFIRRARTNARDVVPVHIEGSNSRFFYNLARLRRWSGIGFNVEMVYLVDEMFKQRGRELTLTFGEPIRFETFDRRRSDWEWARAVKRHVYRLADSPDRVFMEGT